MEQLEGFQLSEDPDYVCRLKKTLYGLKQAPRAWYRRLDKYILQQGFKRGVANNNMYLKSEGEDILVVMVYVDDIIFGSNNSSLVQWFASTMKSELEMFMLGELSYFLGLQVRQQSEGMFISQEVS